MIPSGIATASRRLLLSEDAIVVEGLAATPVKLSTTDVIRGLVVTRS